MADWRGVQEGLVSGYQVGRSSGGKLSGLGMALSKIADSMKEGRLVREEQGRKQNLLGYEGLIKGNIAPTQETTSSFEIPGMGRVKSVIEPKEWKPSTQEEALGFEEAKVGLKQGMTLSQAINILDPMKMYKTKEPILYKKAKELLKEQLQLEEGEVPKLPTKTKGKLPTKIIPETENLMDTNW